MIRWFVPDRLWARFVILLAGALLLSNVIAALLIAREGTALDQIVRLERDAGRLAALVETLEETDKATGRAILRRSQTGYTRFTVEPDSIIPTDAPMLMDLVYTISDQLYDHEVRVATGMPQAMRRGISPLVLISIRLNTGDFAGMWLNSLVYPLTPSTAWSWKAGFFVPLAVSLIGSLIVGGWFIRRMTAPLRRVADAAVAAGQGNRFARLPVDGPLETREVSHAFNEMQQKIADFDASRQHMLAAIGHDLRTPITSLRLRASLTSDESLRPDMIRILDEMAVMSRDIVSYARDSEGAEAPAMTDLTVLLGQTCANFGLSFHHSQSINALVRPITFGRAVSNVIANAIRYAGTAKVTLEQSTKEIIIRVQDRGPGIAQDILPTIKQPFIRGEASRNTDTGGAGLGLAIAEKIVMDHGGRLDLRNRQGGGLEVRITLPS